MRTPLCLLLLAGLLAAAGCDQRMIDQEKDQPYGKSELFPDGMNNRHPPTGAVARDEPAWRKALRDRPPMTDELLVLGRERYGIYCVPCHGVAGYGHGIVVAHGMPQPPSFHEKRLREAPSRHFLSVITRGHGAMYSYAARLPPRERWAVAAYIRALQLSQHVETATLPADIRGRLP